MKHYNAKPSQHSNLGQDLLDAARHRNDTYENPERTKEKRQAKENKKTSEALKAQAIASLNETNFSEVIQSYEIKRALLKFEGFTPSTESIMAELKIFVLEKRSQPNYNTLADAYNRLNNLLRRIRWRVRNFEQAQAYFQPKEKKSFTEVTGVESPWRLNDTPVNLETSKAYLAAVTCGVQFGNSVPDAEREYCLHHLAVSLNIISNYLKIDFSQLGFSFGARGKGGSVAHYEPSAKVLAFNRHRDGSLIHELGHAIDYNLGCVSIPYSIKEKYKEKLKQNEFLWANRSYYMKNTEIFARLFEAYVRANFQDRTSFMIDGGTADLPDLDSEALEFINGALSPLMKGG